MEAFSVRGEQNSARSTAATASHPALHQHSSCRWRFFSCQAQLQETKICWAVNLSLSPRISCWRVPSTASGEAFNCRLLTETTLPPAHCLLPCKGCLCCLWSSWLCRWERKLREKWENVERKALFKANVLLLAIISSPCNCSPRLVGDWDHRQTWFWNQQPDNGDPVQSTSSVLEPSLVFLCCQT